MFSEPPKIRPFSFESQLLAGFETQIQCFISKGDVPIDIEWYFEGNPVSQVNGVHTMNIGTKSSILNIQSVGHSHTGEYACIARNKAGEDIFKSHLTVLGKERNL